MKCGFCNSSGHNKRTCPRLKDYIKKNPDSWTARERKRKQATYAERKCSYCRSAGHNTKTCQVLKNHKTIIENGLYDYRKDVLTYLKKNGIGIGAMCVGNDEASELSNFYYMFNKERKMIYLGAQGSSFYESVYDEKDRDNGVKYTPYAIVKKIDWLNVSPGIAFIHLKALNIYTSPGYYAQNNGAGEAKIIHTFYNRKKISEKQKCVPIREIRNWNIVPVSKEYVTLDMPDEFLNRNSIQKFVQERYFSRDSGYDYYRIKQSVIEAYYREDKKVVPEE